MYIYYIKCVSRVQQSIQLVDCFITNEWWKILVYNLKFHACCNHQLYILIIISKKTCLFTSLKNILPTFVFTFNEIGGLNHTTFLLRFFFSEMSQSAVFALYVNLWLKRLFLRTSEYIEIELQKAFLSDKMSDIRLAIDFGSCFRTTGGWLDSCCCKPGCCQVFYMAGRYRYLN